jgi:outer membrane protein W
MLVAVLGTVSVNAQVPKGSKTLSTNVTGFDFSYSSWEKTNRVNFNLGVTGTYFIIDNLGLTAGFDIASSKLKNIDSSTNFGLTIGGRYYFLGNLYGALAYKGLGRQSQDFASYGNIQLGYDYYITDNVFFEPAVYFEKGFSKIDKSSTLGLSIGIGVNF